MQIDEEIVAFRFYDGITQEDYDKLKKYIKDTFGSRYDDIHEVLWQEKKIN